MIPELDTLVQYISSLPGIGKKSAQRIAFFLLKQEPQYIRHFQSAMDAFYANVRYCDNCGALKSSEKDCQFCASSREQTSICVVEQPSDVYAIESAGEFHGLYHVLMGVLSPLDGIGPSDIRLSELKSRVALLPALQEIIVATNPSIEGNATANYIASLFKERPEVRVTRIASGLALGSQLDYADSKIISESLRGRVKIES